MISPVARLEVMGDCEAFQTHSERRDFSSEERLMAVVASRNVQKQAAV